MIALVLVVGIAVALCVAGWVPLVREAVRPAATLDPAVAPGEDGEVAPEAVTV